MSGLAETTEEVKLIASILCRLLECSTDAHVRNDQLRPLLDRLRFATEALESSCQQFTKNEGGAGTLNSKGELCYTADAARGSSAVQKRTAKKDGKKQFVDLPAKSTMKKSSSIFVRSVPRAVPPKDGLVISKEVGRSLSCSLYNILEGAVNLLQATSANVFVKQGEEMISIVNVSSRLTFPPKVVRHRCAGSIDADVLGSGIALNQTITDPSRSCSRVLVFPVYPINHLPQIREKAIGTIHVECHAASSRSFRQQDESFLLHCSFLVGELLSRVPSMDWMDSFYDPVTQHIVAPFTVHKQAALPLLTSMDNGKRTSGYRSGPVSGVTKEEMQLAKEIDGDTQEVLIKHEFLPVSQSAKVTVEGLSLMPSLREVKNYVENVQDCWKRNAVSNISLMEEDRSSQMKVKTLRRDLAQACQELAEVKERLRLYELKGGDYQQEYNSLHDELTAYLRSRDKLNS